MWSRLSERARRVMYTAGAEAEQRQETIIQPEHILLGLLHPENYEGSVAARILDLWKITPEQVRAVISPPAGTHQPEDKTPEMSSAAKRVVDLAWEEARRLGCNYLGTEHCLLGLVRVEEEAATSTGVLHSLGIHRELARRTVMHFYEQEGKPDSKGSQALYELQRLPSEQTTLLITTGLPFSALPTAAQHALEVYMNGAAQQGRMRVELKEATIQLSDHDADTPASHHIRVTGGTVIATVLEAVPEQPA